MRRTTYIIAGCAALAVGFWLFPAFHVVSLKQANAAKSLGAFSAADFAAKFWKERLAPNLDKAPDAAAVLRALAQDPKSAATNYGRTVGMSDTVFYLLRGTGVVVSVEGKGVGVALRGATGEADLLLKTGLLFGNTVRDATGLLTASEFPNSQEFNDVSTELNRIVESQILPQLKTNTVVGRTLRFAVCAEISEDNAEERPLKAVPLRAEFP